MKTDLNKLPDVHYPGQTVISKEAITEYRIQLYYNGKFDYVSDSNVYLEYLLNTNPYMAFPESRERSWAPKAEFVIIEINSFSSLTPFILYQWNKDHWRKVENV